MQRAATRIELAGAGRRFNHDWIFRKADLHFHAGHAYALTGPNGSGKSTLLQLIGGLLQPSEGKVHYYESDRLLDSENIFRSISLAAPYLDVIEEMTALEFLRFHARFKPFRSGHTPESILERVGLAAAAHKQVRYYSSGMKQRVKLAQAFKNAPSAALRLTIVMVSLPNHAFLLFRECYKISFKLSSAALIVASRSSCVSTWLRNQLSYAEGGRYTPRSSMAWKNLLNRALLADAAVAKSVTG
ncbi:MAG: ATP-binding cassette domain-containing protein [Chitinophagaceae bacterium]|nr:MAG: ATP-binding cassette domain-containing protein [Chitinophagaceae bacterium]